MELERIHNPSLLTKAGFLKKNPDFLTKGGLDAIIFKYKPELLSQGAIVKLGPRRLWIDEARFKAWLKKGEQS